MKVLVVDDDDAILAMLGSFLRRSGYHVFMASNPVRALELAEKEDVKLVITDLMMPHADGIALTEQIHALPGKKDVPVIMITAFGSDEVADESMRRGVALTLKKPLDLAKLADLIGFATHS